MMMGAHRVALIADRRVTAASEAVGAVPDTLDAMQITKLLTVGVVAFALSAPSVAAASPETSLTKQATQAMVIDGKQVSSAAWGRQLVTQFLTILQSSTAAGQLETFLDPAFQVQRADGSRDDKTGYIAKFPTLGPFEIRGYRVTRNRTTIVASYRLTVIETIDGVQYRKTPAPRISTFQFADGAWRMTSHANFNAPS